MGFSFLLYIVSVVIHLHKEPQSVRFDVGGLVRIPAQRDKGIQRVAVVLFGFDKEELGMWIQVRFRNRI